MAVAVSPWPMMPQPMVANWILSFAAVWPWARAAAPSASDAAPLACRKRLRVDAMHHIVLQHAALHRYVNGAPGFVLRIAWDPNSGTRQPDDTPGPSSRRARRKVRAAADFYDAMMRTPSIGTARFST